MILDSDSAWPGAWGLVRVSFGGRGEASCLGSGALLSLMMPKTHKINGHGDFQFHILEMAVFLRKAVLRTLISLSVLQMQGSTL